MIFSYELLNNIILISIFSSPGYFQAESINSLSHKIIHLLSMWLFFTDVSGKEKQKAMSKSPKNFHALTVPILVRWFLECRHSLLPSPVWPLPICLDHGPNIPGSYAILLFTASDLASITSHIHKWALFLLWLHPFILSGVISPLMAPVAYWAPTDLGSSSFSFLSFCLLILFMGFSRQEYWSGPFTSGPHSISTLSTSCEELTHWKRPWCWEGLGAGGEGGNRGWDGWMASLTWWAWVWVNSGSWWWTGRPGVLRFMGSQGVRHDWATGLNWTELNCANP